VWALAAFLFLGTDNWPRCQDGGGLKRLSVEGFSGFILRHRGSIKINVGAFIGYSGQRPRIF